MERGGARHKASVPDLEEPGNYTTASMRKILICVQSGVVPTSASAEAGPGLSTAATFVACIVE